MVKNLIDINGETYPVLVCWGAIGEFCEAKGIEDISNIGNFAKMSAKDLQLLMFWSLYYGCLKEKKAFPLTQSELGMYIGMKEIQEFIKIFTAQMQSMMPAVAEEKEESKKKSRFHFFK